MMVEIKFRTSAFFSATVDINERNIAEIKARLTGSGDLLGGDERNEALISLLKLRSEFDYMDPDDIEEVFIEKYLTHPINSSKTETLIEPPNR